MTVFPNPSLPEIDALRWGGEPRFFAPSYSRSIAQILPSVLELLGQPSSQKSLVGWLPAMPGPWEKVFLLCIDGMGFKELALAPRLQALWEQHGTWITSVFPSITSTALTSIYHAASPAAHGILGHHIWKDFPGGIVDALRMQVVGAKAPLTASGFDVRQWQRLPGVLDTASGPLSRGIQMLPSGIVGSGLSTYAYSKLPLWGFSHPIEGFSRAGDLLNDGDFAWVSLYVSTVDSLAHAFGGGTPEIALALRQIEDNLGLLAQKLRPEALGRTGLVIATDHGHCNIKTRLALDGQFHEWLQQNVRAIGFSGRVMHIYRPKDMASVKDRLRGWLRGRGEVLDFEDAASLVGLASNDPAAAWVRQSLGDLIIVLHAGVHWQKPPPVQTKPVLPHFLRSQHGGLTFDEMIIPWIAAPLSAAQSIIGS